MNRLRAHKSAIIVLLTLLLFGYMVQHSQVFYGGYEKMLYKGLTQVLNEDVILLKGYISINSPQQMEKTTSSILKLNIEGEIFFNKKEGHLDFFIIDPYGSNFLKIGRFYKEGKHYYLMTEVGGVEPIILDELISGIKKQDEGPDRLWNKLYKDVVITNQYKSHRGKSGEISHTKSIDYAFDLIKIVDQNFIQDLSKQIGYEIKLDAMKLICHLDGSGQIISIELKSNELVEMELVISEPERDFLRNIGRSFK